MMFSELRPKIREYPVFSTLDILKWFPSERGTTLKLQLFQWVKKGLLKRVRRDLFWFPEIEIPDNFFIAEKILTPSYISLETALNYHGIIPDVPFSVTSVTPLTTRTVRTPWGMFYFRHLKREYFFDWTTVESPDRMFFYQIATPEKALIDFVYLNIQRFAKMRDFSEERFTFAPTFRWRRVMKLASVFPQQRLREILQHIKHDYEHNQVSMG